MPVFNNILAGAAGSGGAAAYEIERSLRFGPDNARHLSRTPSSAGNRKTFTVSVWAKRSSSDSHDHLFQSGNSYFRFQNSGELIYYWDGGNSVYTNGKFRDFSAWYHVVLVVDTTQSNATDRIKFWVNGVAQETTSTSTQVGQNADLSINNTAVHYIGSETSSVSPSTFDGYMADFHLLDGIAISNPDGVFGEFNEDTGVWDPIAYAGNYNGPADGLGGVTWSSYVTGSVDSNYPLSKCFGGTIGTGYQNGTRSTNPGSLTLNIAALNLNVTNVRLNTFLSGSPTLTVNGTNVSISGGGDQTHVVAVNGQLNSVVWSYDSSNGPYCYMRGIEVDLGDGSGYRLLADGAGSAAGVNGFRLDFSDDSSNSALGNDAAGSTNWTVNNFSVSTLLYAGNAYNGSLNGYMPSGVTQATDPSQLADTSNRQYFFVVNQDNSLNISVVATATSMTVGSSVYDGWGSNNPTTTLDDGTVTPNSSGTDTSVTNKNLATNTFTGLTIGNTYTISTKNGGSGNPHRVHYVTGATVQNAPVVDTDSLLDSPTNREADNGNNGGNYATLSPLTNGSGTAPTNGNLEITTTDGSYGDIGVSIAPSSGKFYVEFFIKSDADRAMIGIASNSTFAASTQFHTLSDAWAYYSDGGVLYNSSNSSTFGDSYGAGDVIGIALDKDNNKLYFSKNGTFQNSSNPSTGTGGIDISSVSGKPSFIIVNDVSGAAKTSVAFNAGQRPFAIPSVPTGFKSLCTQNFPDPLIENPSTAFDVKTFAGNGSTQTISGLNMSPDIVWLKSRSAAANHSLFDAVRGAQKGFHTNLTNAEFNDSSTLTGFTSDGWTMAGHAVTNANNQNYVGWAWDAGSSNTTVSAGSLNSATYDQSANWSTLVTTSALHSSYNSGGSTSKTGCFDGLQSTSMYSASGPLTITFDSSAFPASGGPYFVEVETNQRGIKVNGQPSSGYTTNIAPNQATYWANNGSVSALTSIEVNQANSAYGGMCNRIRVNGKILVDTSITAPNFPSISSTCRTNQTAGISIVSWTGAGASGAASVGHNLNAPVDFMILKRRSGGAASWPVWWSAFESSSTSDYFFLDAPDAKGNGSYNFWNNQSPDSSVFHISDNSNVNAQNDPIIGYIFSSVDGFSKFGKYQSSGATYVHTGFRPRVVIFKSSVSAHWIIMDAARDVDNGMENHLHPNLANAEATAADRVDFLSNGFKLISNYGETNDGQVYYYAAFAESPLKYSRAR